MLKMCGKHVRSLGIVGCKPCGYSSPVYRMTHRDHPTHRVKVLEVHISSDSFPLLLSTLVSLFLPLFKHYFYPISTVPTITFTEEKI